jgi:DNA-binding MarR family transcriptional regulator
LSDETNEFQTSDIYLTQAAVGLSPEPFGLGHIYNRMPYTNPERIRRQLREAVDRGWLFIVSEGVYQATERGYKYYRRLCREYDHAYSEIKTLHPEKLERIENLLSTLVYSIEQTKVLNYKPAFDMDVKLAHQGNCFLQKICCRLSMIMAYRDDAFVNAWMDQEVNGFAWEAFSYIYKGRANTANQLARKLERCRYYDEESYAAALKELKDRDWIDRKNGFYEPTEEGLRILAKVTQETNRYFYVPWEILSSDDTKQLKVLLEKLAEKLKQAKPRPWFESSNVKRNLGWRSIQWARENVR